MLFLGSAFPSKTRAIGVAGAVGFVVAALLLLTGVRAAHADSLPQAVALPPHTQQPTRDATLSRELERALVQLGVFELLPRPAFDLEAVQLAIDCVEESVECLRQVAARSHAQIVIAPTVERAHGALVLSLLYFDAKAGAPPRKVARKQAGDELDRDTFDALPALLRQLLPPAVLSAAEQRPAAEADATPAGDQLAPLPVASDATQPAADQGGRKLPLGPLILGAGGVALLATSAIFGALVSGAEDDYSQLQIRTEADVGKAEAEIESGKSKAVIANVLLGAGAAAVVGAGVWLALELALERSPNETALVPVIGKDYAGLSLSGRLGARP